MREWFKARNVWGAAISALSDEEAGRLAKAIWAYTMNGEVVELEGAGKGIFALVLMTLAQDEQHDERVSQARSKASKSRFDEQTVSKADQLQSNDINSNQLITNDDNKNKNKNKSKNKEQEKEIEEYFDRFWSSYPRHVSKQQALKEFQKLNPNEELLQTMLMAIDKQKQSAQWQENGGQFIPHPSTWLHNKRWEDEVSKAQPQRKVMAQGYEQRDYTDEDEDARKRMLQSLQEGA